MYITLSKDEYDKLSCEASKMLSFESCVEKELKKKKLPRKILLMN